jgi:predicted ferric reductase
MGYTTINTFNDIPIIEKTLVLCDIDETLLTTKIIKLVSNKDNKMVKLCYLPKYTDKDGFLALLEKIKITNSKLIFITARRSTFAQITYNQFKLLDIDKNVYPIFFCGETPKSKIVKKNINLNNFSNIIFIDDLKYNLYHMKKEFSDLVKLFLFQKK